MNQKCECPETGRLRPEIADLYLVDAELPYVKHEPHRCECTNDLATYRRGDKILLLCSCCWMPSDTRLDTQ
jgi:hypothetical protein